MWQPSSRQWLIIWPVALLVVLAWPPDKGRSLAMSLVNWAVDPRGDLPVLPASLPMSLDDDGDAVTEHDMAENAYVRARQRSMVTRWRIDLKNADDPVGGAEQRQLLVAFGVVGALLVWRLDASRGR